jgi:type IV pilus assembly PilX-like protein
MSDNFQNRRDAERGIALITALMMSTMLLALGMAIALSTTTDTVISKSQRVGEQAFFAADAGVAIARRAIATAIQEEIKKIQDGTATYGEDGFTRLGNPASPGDFPDFQVVPDPNINNNSTTHPFYVNVKNRAIQLAQYSVRDNRIKDLNGSRFTVEYFPMTGLITDDLTPGENATAKEYVVLRYSFRVSGYTESGGRASVIESGRISTTITVVNTAVPGTDRSFSFSGFGAFFDNGDTIANAPLASGTFSGPVHTNTHFAFLSSRNVSFRNVVSQVDNYIRYDSTSFSTGHRSIPTSDITGIDISSEGYQRTNTVPLPDNNFSQEFAVINATGILDLNPDGTPVDPPAKTPLDIAGNPLPIFGLTGRVTPQALALNLRNASNQEPTISGNQIVQGVYISSSNGSSISGAGIYVKGDATDIQLTTNGTEQIYVISQTQSSTTTTTTITVKPASNQTVIQSGSNTRTFTGVPTDRSDPNNPKPGLSLFVDGSIRSLRGGTVGSTRRPAIASGTRLTVTAQRDITVTGDLKYADPVVNSDGTAVSNLSSVQNVLGLFTNDGNVNLAPNSSYVSSGLNLEMNAAVIAFNSTTQNDGSRIEGSIAYTGSTSTSSSDRWKLIGSRVQAKINSIGYSNRDIFFDTRFSGGSFRPPFFPGTNYALGTEEVSGDVSISKADSPKPTSVSWYRENN